VGVHHDLASPIASQLDQFGKKPPIEDWRIAAVVTETRNDDPSGHEGLHQCLDGLNRQVRLVRDTDQRGICCLCERAQPDGDRAADAVFGMGVVHHRQRQTRKRVTERRLGRHDRDHRLKTSIQEAARGFPDE